MLGGLQLSKRDDDNVYPLKRPQQRDLFPANDVRPTRRIDPKRALIRFKVRADWKDDDVPLSKPVQIGLDDASVDREQLAREVRHGEPLSERAILRELEGDDSSGHRRAAFNREVTECVEAYYHAAKALYGHERAVCMLFSMVSKAPSYLAVCPEWMIEVLFIEEKELVFEVFHGLNGDRRTELGESEDEG